MNNDPETTELATGFTVGNYKAARTAQDRTKIAEAIRVRFTERYIKPATDTEHKHGFTIMAISCLMVEALESFRRGWTNSRDRSEAAFCYFFNTNDGFKELSGCCEQFYKHVRCGILHQAETTGGWLITRNKSQVPFFDPESFTVNATSFMEKLTIVLNEFCDELRTDDWNSKNWKNVVKKMDKLCDNCRPPGK
jgi:hypothetical protein